MDALYAYTPILTCIRLYKFVCVHADRCLQTHIHIYICICTCYMCICTCTETCIAFGRLGCACFIFSHAPPDAAILAHSVQFGSGRIFSFVQSFWVIAGLTCWIAIALCRHRCDLCDGWRPPVCGLLYRGGLLSAAGGAEWHQQVQAYWAPGEQHRACFFWAFVLEVQHYPPLDGDRMPEAPGFLPACWVDPCPDAPCQRCEQGQGHGGSRLPFLGPQRTAPAFSSTYWLVGLAAERTGPGANQPMSLAGPAKLRVAAALFGSGSASSKQARLSCQQDLCPEVCLRY